MGLFATDPETWTIGKSSPAAGWPKPVQAQDRRVQEAACLGGPRRYRPAREMGDGRRFKPLARCESRTCARDGAGMPNPGILLACVVHVRRDVSDAADLEATVCCGDLRCSQYCARLGIDSSHLFFLLRVLIRNVAAPNAAKGLADLLDQHSCQRTRELVTTSRCLDAECFPKNGGLSLLDARVDRDLVTARVIAREPEVPQGFPQQTTINGRRINFDAGERELTHLLDSDCKAGAALVTYDEDAYDVVRELAETGVVAVIPIRSIQLLGAMFDCRAIVADDIVAICGAALDDIDERMGNMSERKRSAKTSEINALLNRVALSVIRTAKDGASS